MKKGSDNSGLIDPEFLYFLAGVAIAVALVFARGWVAGKLILSIVIFVAAENFVSRFIHPNKWVRVAVSTVLATWFFFIMSKVAEAAGAS